MSASNRQAPRPSASPPIVPSQYRFEIPRRDRLVEVHDVQHVRPGRIVLDICCKGVEAVTGAEYVIEAVVEDLAVVARDVPGFVGNRLQYALWREAIALISDRVQDPRMIDRVLSQTVGSSV